jgi:hypothetical protein
MKKIIVLLFSFMLVFVLSCAEDPDCKTCYTVTEIYDDDGNLISSEEGNKDEYCDEDLYEIESQEPEEIGDQKTYWVCE